MTAHIDVTGVRLETERLILREWKKDDIHDFFEYASIPEVGLMAGWLPHRNIEQTDRILSSLMEMKTYFAIELKETGRVIGSIGYQNIESDPVQDHSEGIEIGFDLNKAYWGKGIVPEALNSLIDYSFRFLNLDYLVCWHFASNEQSHRVLQKSGFYYVHDIVCKDAYDVDMPAQLYLLENTEKIIRKMSAPFDVTGIRMETDRLLLRPWEEADLMDFHEYAQLEEVAGPAGWKASQNLEMSKEQLKRYMDDKETFALVLKENRKVIGSFSVQRRPWQLYPIDRNLQGREFGFDLHSKYWGRGLMPEAARAVTDYCFETLGYDFVTCGHFLGNDQSGRCIEKSGFKFLFEKEFDLPTGVTQQIRTYIRYNPRKET